MKTALTISMTLLLAAGPALADGDYEDAKGAAVRAAAQATGTLHPGHLATVATGKYDMPSAAYHFDAAGNPISGGYAPGPGGWAETRKAAKSK